MTVRGSSFTTYPLHPEQLLPQSKSAPAIVPAQDSQINQISGRFQNISVWFQDIRVTDRYVSAPDVRLDTMNASARLA